jgi:hypothetical protein
LGYLDMHRLLQSAAAVYTDSGGLQKEAYFHRIPASPCAPKPNGSRPSKPAGTASGAAPLHPRHDIAAYGEGHAAEQAVEPDAGFSLRLTTLAPLAGRGQGEGRVSERRTDQFARHEPPTHRYLHFSSAPPAASDGSHVVSGVR